MPMGSDDKGSPGGPRLRPQPRMAICKKEETKLGSREFRLKKEKALQAQNGARDKRDGEYSTALKEGA